MSRPSAQDVPVGLGLPKFDVSSFAVVVSNLFVAGETIIQFCGGVDHYAVVCKSGKVYTFRRDDHIQLGLLDAGGLVPVPTPVSVPGFLRVEQVACARNFTLFLTEEGKLFGSWANSHVSGEKTVTSSPISIKWEGAERTVRKIAAGVGHVLALTTTGTVLSLVQNLTGKLCLSLANQPSAENQVVDFSCGGYHSAILYGDGSLHTAGWNGDGQLGLAEKTITTKLFLPVLLPTRVRAAACGFEHSVALCVDGSVWAWGRNHRGQLGVGDRVDRDIPKRMLGTEGYKIKKVVAGRVFTALVTEQGDVLMCGGQDEDCNSDLQVATLVGRSPQLLDMRVDCALSSATRLLERERKRKREETDDAILSGLEKTVKSCVECPICSATMIGPIRMCEQGHSVCDKCRSRTEACATCRKPFVVTRNFALEGLVSEVRLRCKECSEAKFACGLDGHAKVCTARQYKCPVGDPCEWRGILDSVLTHVVSTHPDDIWIVPHVFMQHNGGRYVDINVLSAFGRVFILQRKHMSGENELYISVYILGPVKSADGFKFSFKMTSLKSGTVITFSKKVSAETDAVCGTQLTESESCISVHSELYNMFLGDGGCECEINVLKQDLCAGDNVKSLLDE